MTIELVQDNLAIIQALNETDTTRAMGNLKTTKNQNILKFFCALCVCQKSAVHSHQNFICRELFENKANANALFEITYDASKDMVMIRTDRTKSTSKSLIEYIFESISVQFNWFMPGFLPLGFILRTMTKSIAKSIPNTMTTISSSINLSLWQILHLGVTNIPLISCGSIYRTKLAFQYWGFVTNNVLWRTKFFIRK